MVRSEASYASGRLDEDFDRKFVLEVVSKWAEPSAKFRELQAGYIGGESVDALRVENVFYEALGEEGVNLDEGWAGASATLFGTDTSAIAAEDLDEYVRNLPEEERRELAKAVIARFSNSKQLEALASAPDTRRALATLGQSLGKLTGSQHGAVWATGLDPTGLLEEYAMLETDQKFEQQFLLKIVKAMAKTEEARYAIPGVDGSWGREVNVTTKVDGTISVFLNGDHEHYAKDRPYFQSHPIQTFYEVRPERNVDVVYPGDRIVRVPAFWLVRLSELSAQQAVKTGVVVASIVLGPEELALYGVAKGAKVINKARTALTKGERVLETADDVVGHLDEAAALERGVDATDEAVDAGRTLSPREVVEQGTAAEFKVAGESHHVYFAPNVGGKIELQLCSRNCAALRDKVTEMLKAVPEGHAARKELKQILDATERVLEDLDANMLTLGAADARAERMAKQLELLSKKYPKYIDPNVVTYESRVQRWNTVSQHSNEIASELNKFDSTANFTADEVDAMIAAWDDAKHGAEGHQALNLLENARYGDLTPEQARELAKIIREPGGGGPTINTRLQQIAAHVDDATLNRLLAHTQNLDELENLLRKIDPARLSRLLHGAGSPGNLFAIFDRIPSMAIFDHLATAYKGDMVVLAAHLAALGNDASAGVRLEKMVALVGDTTFSKFVSIDPAALAKFEALATDGSTGSAAFARLSSGTYNAHELNKLGSLDVTTLKNLADIPDHGNFIFVTKTIGEAPLRNLGQLSGAEISQLVNRLTKRPARLTTMGSLTASQLRAFLGITSDTTLLKFSDLTSTELSTFAALTRAELENFALVDLAGLRRLSALSSPTLSSFVRLGPSELAAFSRLSNSQVATWSRVQNSTLTRLASRDTFTLGKLADGADAPGLDRLAGLSDALVRELSLLSPAAMRRLLQLPPNQLIKFEGMTGFHIERLAQRTPGELETLAAARTKDELLVEVGDTVTDRNKADADVRLLDNTVTNPNTNRPRGHASDHAARTSQSSPGGVSAVEIRLRTGRTPSNVPGPRPPDVGVFASDAAQVEAARLGEAKLQAEIQAGNVLGPNGRHEFTIQMNGVGYSYKVEGGSVDASGNLVGGTLVERQVDSFIIVYEAHAHPMRQPPLLSDYFIVTMFPKAP